MGAFMLAHTANRQATKAAAFEFDPVSVAILKFIQEEHRTNALEGPLRNCSGISIGLSPKTFAAPAIGRQNRMRLGTQWTGLQHC